MARVGTRTRVSGERQLLPGPGWWPDRHRPLPALGHHPAQLADPVDAVHQPVAGGVGLGASPVELVDLPLVEDDRHQDLIVVDAGVVDAGLGDEGAVAVEVGDAGAGHGEVAHLVLDGDDGRGRIELEGRGVEVPVEEVVQVLVRRDAGS